MGTILPKASLIEKYIKNGLIALYGSRQIVTLKYLTTYNVYSIRIDENYYQTRITQRLVWALLKVQRY